MSWNVYLVVCPHQSVLINAADAVVARSQHVCISCARATRDDRGKDVRVYVATDEDIKLLRGK